MAGPANAPYHVGPQSAAVLLGPILAELESLHVRLAHYHGRLRMADQDRATIARARDALARVVAEIASLRGEP